MWKTRDILNCFCTYFSQELNNFKHRLYFVQNIFCAPHTKKRSNGFKLLLSVQLKSLPFNTDLMLNQPCDPGLVCRSVNTHTHTHIHLFNGSLRGSQKWSRKLVQGQFPKMTCLAVCFEPVSVFLLPSVHASKHRLGREKEVSLKEGERENKGLTVMTSSSELQCLFCFAASRREWLYSPAGALQSSNIQIITSGMINYDRLCNCWSCDTDLSNHRSPTNLHYLSDW